MPVVMRTLALALPPLATGWWLGCSSWDSLSASLLSGVIGGTLQSTAAAASLAATSSSALAQAPPLARLPLLTAVLRREAPWEAHRTPLWDKLKNASLVAVPFAGAEPVSGCFTHHRSGAAPHSCAWPAAARTPQHLEKANEASHVLKADHASGSSCFLCLRDLA